VGDSVVEAIESGRPYSSFRDFMERCRLDQATIVALIQSGAFGTDRDPILRQYAEMLFERKEYKPVVSTPSRNKMEESHCLISDSDFKNKDTRLQLWNDHKRMLFEAEQDEKYTKHMSDFEEKYMGSPEMYEYNTLSVFISDHPFKGLPEKYLKPFSSFEDGEKCLVGGTITRVERKKQKDGKTMAYIDLLTLDTEKPLIEGMCFGDVFAQNAPLIKRGSNVAVLGKKSGEQIIVRGMQPLETWKAHLEELESKKSQAT
jgi:DNA polymerase-3 subunit alpha